MFFRRKKVIFAVLYIAYTSIYIARVNLSVASPALIEMGVLDTVQVGALGSVFSTVYALGRLINGGFSDRTPPWKMLTAGLILAGLSNLAISFLPPFVGIFLLWTANAYTQSMLWGSVLCVVSRLYKKGTAKQKSSIMVTSVATGNILSILLNSALITRFGVRYAFAVPGILTLLLGALVLLCTRHIEEEPVSAQKRGSMLTLLKNRELLLMSLPALFHGMMKENVTLWMAVFIVDTYSVDLSTSAYYILLIPVIGLIGRMLYPVLYKLCREEENAVSLICFGACGLCALVLCFGKISILVSILALSLVYAASSMINTTLTSIYPLRYMDSGNVASVSGLMDFGAYFGAGISSAVYGVVIKSFGYFPMFASWLLVCMISLVMIWYLKKSKQNKAGDDVL